MHHDHSSSEAETPATGQQPFVLQVASVKGRGGITTAVGHYARMFERNGVATAVVFRGPAANELRAQGIDVIDAPRLLLSPIAVAFPLQRLRAEVAKRAGGSRLIVLAHSDRALPALRRIFPRAFFITPCHSDKFHHKRGADLVITLNPAQSALARVALPHARIRELGNPYAPLETTPTPTEHASPSEGMPVRFNFLGRLEGFKDPGTLIRAFAIAALDPRTTLRIIGAGPLLHELQHEAQPLGARVEFAGWKAGPFASFGPADVLVLPSTWESYSYVIREALDHGAPIIASDIGVHRDALGDGAFGELFPAGDAQALARRLEQAQTGLESMRARAAQGRRALLERYGAAAFWNAFRAAVEAAD